MKVYLVVEYGIEDQCTVAGFSTWSFAETYCNKNYKRVSDNNWISRDSYCNYTIEDLEIDETP